MGPKKSRSQPPAGSRRSGVELAPPGAPGTARRRHWSPCAATSPDESGSPWTRFGHRRWRDENRLGRSRNPSPHGLVKAPPPGPHSRRHGHRAHQAGDGRGGVVGRLPQMAEGHAGPAATREVPRHRAGGRPRFPEKTQRRRRYAAAGLRPPPSSRTGGSAHNNTPARPFPPRARGCAVQRDRRVNALFSRAVAPEDRRRPRPPASNQPAHRPAGRHPGATIASARTQRRRAAELRSRGH